MFVNILPLSSDILNRINDWSLAEKTFVKQSMMLCAFEILLKIGRFEGGKSYLAI